MFRRLLDFFLYIFPERIEAPSSTEKIDVVIPISYGTLLGGLTNASAEIFRRAASSHKHDYPDSWLVYANSSHCFPGSETEEGAMKSRMLDNCGVLRRHVLEAGSATNSVTEARVIRNTLDECAATARNMLLVTGVSHAPSAHFIYRKVFPGARIFFLTIPFSLEYQSDNPFFIQRNCVTWFLASVGRYLALRVLGLDFMARLQHASPSD